MFDSLKSTSFWLWVRAFAHDAFWCWWNNVRFSARSLGTLAKASPGNWVFHITCVQQTVPCQTHGCWSRMLKCSYPFDKHTMFIQTAHKLSEWEWEMIFRWLIWLLHIHFESHIIAVHTWSKAKGLLDSRLGVVRTLYDRNEVRLMLKQVLHLGRGQTLAHDRST